MRKTVIFGILAFIGIVLVVFAWPPSAGETPQETESQRLSSVSQIARIPQATSTPPAMMAQIEPSFTPPSRRPTAAVTLSAKEDIHSHDHDGEITFPAVSATPGPTEWVGSSLAMLPDLQNLPPSNLRLIIDPESGRMFVRFQNSILNAGPGALELIGHPSADRETIIVSQRVYRTGEEQPVETLVGEFIFHPEHNHWHLNDFAVYEIWSLTREGNLLSPIASGGKVSYCVTDTEYFGDGIMPSSPAPRPAYTTCYEELQGISPGWVDIYFAQYPGQYVEITDLEDGVYALISTVDPDDTVRESVEYNNTGVTYFELRDQQLHIVEPPRGVHSFLD